MQVSEQLEAAPQLPPYTWLIGRTQTEDLSPECYGMVLHAFEEHGPKHVLERMAIPHYTDRLPQEPVGVLRAVARCCMCELKLRRAYRLPTGGRRHSTSHAPPVGVRRS